MAQSKNKIKDAFHNQRHTSELRNIPFKFTFEEWRTWWEAELGSDWFKKRGCKRGQYVMARFGDLGSYEIGNVKCITSYDNAIERNLRQKAENHPNTKITADQARLIKRSELPGTELARQLGVTRQTIYRVRSGKMWSQIT